NWWRVERGPDDARPRDGRPRLETAGGVQGDPDSQGVQPRRANHDPTDVGLARDAGRRVVAPLAEADVDPPHDRCPLAAESGKRGRHGVRAVDRQRWRLRAPAL